MHFSFRLTFRPLVVIAALLSLATSLSAQLTFTLSGYNVADNNPVTNTFVIAPGYHAPNQPIATIDADFEQYVWGSAYDALSSTTVFSNISGTNLSGTVTTPTEQLAVVAYSRDLNTNQFTFMLAGLTTEPAGFGITLPGEVPVRFIYAVLPVSINFTAPPADISAENYFAAYSGTYQITDGGMIFSDAPFAMEVYGEQYAITSFSINAVASAASAVPEPSTYAAIAGVCALGVALWRRRAARA